MTNTKKVLIAGALLLIWYEWQGQQGQAAPGPQMIPTNPSSPIPLWVQQMSATAGNGAWSSTDTTTELMSLPNGPGGTAPTSGGPGALNPFQQPGGIFCQ